MAQVPPRLAHVRWHAASPAAAMLLLVGLMSLGVLTPVSGHAKLLFRIDGVHVSPADPIHPGDPVSLEITIRTPTSPAFLTQPTDVEVVGHSIFVDVYASSGRKRAIDKLTEVVDLGRFSPGTYPYTVTLISEFDSNFGREMPVVTGHFTILRGSADEGVCDELLDATPGLYELCVAFCEARDLSPDSRLMDVYERIRRADDPDLPCVCPCWSREELESIAPNPETESWNQRCRTGDDALTEIDSIERIRGTTCRGRQPCHVAIAVARSDRTLECIYRQVGVGETPDVTRVLIGIDEAAYAICRDQIRDRQWELDLECRVD